jgi:Holliday junction resolvasome RuvABC endonuclease subunit
MKREPIKLELRETPLVRVMGVDPGFATMGIAILEQLQNQRPRVLHLSVTATEKQSNRKALVVTRVSTDDQRRLSELWEALGDAAGVPERRPFILAVEAYRPFSGRGGGNAWKSAVGYGLVSAFARAQGWPCMVFLPEDLKRAFTLSRSSSKQAVEDAVCEKVDGLRESLDDLKESEREHAADAAGHAYLAIVEVAKHTAQLSGLLRQGTR